MSDFFTYSKRESAVDVVINSIKQLLIDGKLKPGDKIPNELEISQGLGVSRGSVREAMKILSALGIVDIKVGNGTYVRSKPDSELLDSLLFSYYITNPNINEFMEMRRKLEEDVMELVLDHYDENADKREKIYKNLEELSSIMNNNADPADLTENDLEFHHLLGQATCNGLASLYYDSLIKIMESSIHTSHLNQKGEYVYLAHRKVVEVIKHRDYSSISEVADDAVTIWQDLQPANPIIKSAN